MNANSIADKGSDGKLNPIERSFDGTNSTNTGKSTVKKIPAPSPMIQLITEYISQVCTKQAIKLKIVIIATVKIKDGFRPIKSANGPPTMLPTSIPTI